MTTPDPMQRFFSTDRASSLLLAQRVVLGAVMLPHGAQKLLGFAGTMQFLTGTVGLPAPLAFLVIVAESFGALALVLGVGTRLAALGIASVMIGAVLTTHVQHGFFMNWGGTQGGEGFEYHLLALALALPLVVLGGGRWALDGWLADRVRGRALGALAATLLVLASVTVPQPVAAEGARVVVEVAGLRTSHGLVRGALYASRDGWTDCGREVATCHVGIRGAHATCVLDDVAPGTYALAFLHDEDDDGDLDRDWIGIPQEGFGFSNDAPPRLGPPSFDAASFVHAAPETRLHVHARYGI